MCPATVNVQATIVHQIIKEARQTTETPPKIRDKLNSNPTQVIKLIDFLDDLLTKHGLAHSYSSTFANTNTLSKVLNDYLFLNLVVPAEANESPEVVQAETPLQTRYRRITNKLTYALHFHIFKDLLTTGDHLPLIFYSQDGIDYLYLALLSLTDSITIDEETGDILDTTLIDSKALKIACKINLTNMKKHADSFELEGFEPSNYVAWIQKSSEKIVEYMQDYIPIQFRIDDKHATNKIMKTLISYLVKSPFDNKTRAEIHSEVVGLLKRKAKAKEPINIVEEIDPIIVTKALLCGTDITNHSFKSFREENGYSATDENSSNVFSPAKDPLGNYETFDLSLGNNNSLKISGYQSDLGHKIHLIETDPDNPKLEIDLTATEAAKYKQVLRKSNPYESTQD